MKVLNVLTGKTETIAPGQALQGFHRLAVDQDAGPDPSRTRQEFRDECDINVLMKKYERDGLLAHVREFNGQYGDFTNVPQSYQDACNQIIAAQEMFMSIPAEVRAKFDNDPGKFLELVESDPEGEKLYELGLTRADFLPPSKRPKDGAAAPAAAAAPAVSK